MILLRSCDVYGEAACPGNAPADPFCAAGYHGPTCSICESGYYKGAKTCKCVFVPFESTLCVYRVSCAHFLHAACPPVYVSALLFVVFIIVVVVFLVLMSYAKGRMWSRVKVVIGVLQVQLALPEYDGWCL